MSEAEKFLGLNFDQPPDEPSEISIKRKLTFILSVWFLGFLIACPDPRCVLLIPAFPFGLAAYIQEWIVKLDQSEAAILIIGWLIYAGFTVGSLSMKRRRWFYMCWVVLTTLLVLNGVGCHAMLKELGKIH